MGPEVIIAISELAKLGIMVYVNYMKQAGLNEEQINNVFKEAQANLYLRNPAKIPD